MLHPEHRTTLWLKRCPDVPGGPGWRPGPPPFYAADTAISQFGPSRNRLDRRQLHQSTTMSAQFFNFRVFVEEY